MMLHRHLFDITNAAARPFCSMAAYVEMSIVLPAAQQRWQRRRMARAVQAGFAQNLHLDAACILPQGCHSGRRGRQLSRNMAAGIMKVTLPQRTDPIPNELARFTFLFTFGTTAIVRRDERRTRAQQRCRGSRWISVPGRMTGGCRTTLRRGRTQEGISLVVEYYNTAQAINLARNGRRNSKRAVFFLLPLGAVGRRNKFIFRDP